MKIAVIGKGKIGGTLAGKWQAAGHDVVYGARDGSGPGPDSRTTCGSSTLASRTTSPNRTGYRGRARPA
jgi:predicted dinucleotide-binding enzyme